MNNGKRAFKKTGKNVTVSKEDLVSATVERLMDYDSTSPSDRKGKTNPYTDSLYVQVANGKTVQIPRYVQHAAIVKWDSMKNAADNNNSVDRQTGHTRIDRRKRYCGSDPYIMNKNLQDGSYLPEGGPDDDIDYDDVEPDMELNKLRKWENRNKGAVGSDMVPNEKYGKGGAYGDLPRDYEIYNAYTAPSIQDNQQWGEEPKPGQVMPDDLDDLEYPLGEYNLAYQQNVENEEKHDVGMRNVRGSGGDYSGIYVGNGNKRCRNGAKGIMGPNVIGTDADIRAESGTAETVGVEQYATIDGEGNVIDEVDDVNYGEKKCAPCNKRRDYGQNVKHVDDIYEVDREREQDYLDLDLDIDDHSLDGDADNNEVIDINEYDYEQKKCHGVYDNVEHLNYSVNCTDPAFKWLFFLMLIIFIFLIYYYKKYGNFNFTFT